MKKMIKRKTVILCMLLLGISVSGCGKTREVDEASSKVIQISVAPEETSPTPAPDQVASAAVTTNGNLTMVNTYLAEQDAAGISSAESGITCLCFLSTLKAKLFKQDHSHLFRRIDIKLFPCLLPDLLLQFSNTYT